MSAATLMSPSMPPLAMPLLRAAIAASALLAAAAMAQVTATGRETPKLDAKEYPQLEEVVVRARQPQWRQKETAPDWNREKFKFDPEVEQPRLQVAPKYTRDERDDYDQVRDRMNAEPQLKLFEFKF